ncbi:RagB/SusD family nutrient uptake outer membrane protein [Myroides sp. M-43]|uniref:RagB/SusD family nutrient uptake outer membrane protein n=1 Tax=Myroides oncorhynchi TaxID=2893756 RepID=UPI001E63C45F|nr:RagB/SusD family nutrient uptake outer membrane protein [Myroides oncorhynchi]MCC9044282.1 RagB/SusD family nutrient uptake outer membrane protein [Myroides oncorhynchi]
MKKYRILFLACLAIATTSCSEDYLDRTPLSDVTGENFFQKESDLILFSNSFYRMFPSTSIYNGDSSSDNIIQSTLSEEMRGARTVPTTGGGWSWGDLRNINYFLENYERVPDKNVTKHYGGIAKFFRAYFYFEKVKRFGDVPWYDYVIDPNDTKSLEKPRDPRNVVVDNIMKDLDFAIENMKPTKSAYRVSKWTALALKVRVGLYEGTFMKYRGLKGYEKYLTQATVAAEQLMKESGYKLYSTGKPEQDYLNLFASHSAIDQEIILAREFSTELNIKHNVNYYTITSSYGRPGMPKDLVNSYLMKDGSRFTDIPNYNKMQFAEETKNRDLRLYQTVRTPKYKRIGGNIELAPDLSATVTGYQLIKYVTESQFDTNSASIVDLPLFRYAEVLLNFAEAKAELGTLTQEDLDKSINVIRTRAGMPSLDLGAANANPDPYIANQYRNVQNTNKGVILEIRRERRIELYMEDHRWEDIVRWKEGQKLTQPIEGMYFPGIGAYDLDQNGTVDIHLYDGQKPENQKGVYYVKLGRDLNLSSNNLVEPHPTFRTRTFKEDKDYLYPIPVQELQLNPNLKQNPGW